LFTEQVMTHRLEEPSHPERLCDAFVASLEALRGTIARADLSRGTPAQMRELVALAARVEDILERVHRRVRRAGSTT